MLGARGRGWLLQPETFRVLHRPREGQDYALGWVVVASPLAGGLALTHAGSNLNWYSVAWIMPVLNIALFVVTNQGGEVGFQAVDETVGALMQYAGETIPGVALIVAASRRSPLWPLPRNGYPARREPGRQSMWPKAG